MNVWYYTDAQIRTLYRDSKDKREQIEIISQLEAKPKEKIIEKLRSLGEVIDLPDRKVKVKKVHRDPWTAWTPQEDELIRQAAARGLNASETAELLPGRTVSAVSQRRNKFGIYLPIRKSGAFPIWTPAEDAIVKAAYEKGTPIEQIVELLKGRTDAAIRTRIKRQGWRRK